jgi:ribosome-associated protein
MPAPGLAKPLDKRHSETVEIIQFQLQDEHVRLCDLLKLAGIAQSGGQGKHMVADGAVTVDGRPETRKTAKIRAGQTVECHGVVVRVLAK